MLSGGPSSVLRPRTRPASTPRCSTLGVPVLGICYGCSCWRSGSAARSSRPTTREYGRALLEARARDDPLFAGVGRARSARVWMSHGDRVLRLPAGLRACSPRSDELAVRRGAPRDAADLRPAVPPRGRAHRGRRADPRELRARHLRLRRHLDAWRRSSTSAVAAHPRAGRRAPRGLRALGRRRLVGRRRARAPRDRRPAAPASSSTTACCASGEREEVEAHASASTCMKLRSSRRRERALPRRARAASTDPEQKRKIIGHVFIEVFEEEAAKLGDASSSSCRARSTPT